MKLDVFQPPKNTSVLYNASNTATTIYTMTTAIHFSGMTLSIANDESNCLFIDYLLMDAYLRFLVGLVSAKSIFPWNNIGPSP